MCIDGVIAMKITRMISLMALLVIVGLNGFAQGATVEVSWNANSESDIAGYKVYCGVRSGVYTLTIDTGLNTSADVTDLAAGTTYYFAVKAYNTSNLYSVYSSEISITTPEDSEEELPTDTDRDGIPDLDEMYWGMDLLDPLDSLDDYDGDGSVNLVEYMARTSLIDASDCPEIDNLLKDIIGEIGSVIDLSSVNPGGTYTITPLLNSYPSAVNNTLIIQNPGAYLYNVMSGTTLVYRLRVSVADDISTIGSFSPGSFLSLADQIFGISIQLPADAVVRQVPIGIGGPTAVAAAVDYTTGTTEFDILPYDLVLAKPAVVTISNVSGTPTIERYDTASSTWVDVESTADGQGRVIFSTEQFGTFRLIADESPSKSNGSGSEIPEGSASAGSGGGGGGGGGCFITTAGF